MCRVGKCLTFVFDPHVACMAMADVDEAELVERFEDIHISLQLPGARLFRGDQSVGTGLLTIDEYEVNWASEIGDKVCLSYPEICLHAVSRDTSSFPHPCLYMLTCPLQAESSGDDQEEEDTPGETVEMRLVLENNDDLDRLFEIISEGQSLHPDPEDVSSEEEEEEEPNLLEDIQPLDEGAGFFRTVEDLQYLSPEGQRTLEHIEQLLATSGSSPSSAQNGDGQFEDAED